MQGSEPSHPPITGRFASPEETSWHEFRRQSEQDTPRRLEEAAKYLSGLVSIVFTIFMSREEGIFKDASHWLTGFVCVTFLASLTATLFVIFPLRWQQVAQSAQSIEAVHRESVRHKYRLLRLGVALYLVAMGALVYMHGQ